MNKQVNVLISTYNGEKYITEQIDSIKNQTYKNIKIYVRDDGSTDNTKQILEKLMKNGDITYMAGENVRWGRSFLQLLQLSNDGDYWAFCDQDDVWFPEKIEYAVEWLEKQNENEPCLYHSSYYLMDESLTKKLGVYTKPNYEFDFRRSLTDCLYQGFSMVFNKKLRELMLMGDINNISSHDWWACLLVTKFGISTFDERVTSYHRRLDTSMSGGGLKGKLKWFKNTLQNKDSDINNVAREYVKTFESVTDKEDLKLVGLFVNDKYSLIKALKKTFYPKRWRALWSSEISIRLLMLLGKI
jgi:glycosyltransferase involved in cell wall biosynthesis